MTPNLKFNYLEKAPSFLWLHTVCCAESLKFQMLRIHSAHVVAKYLVSSIYTEITFH